MVGIILRTLINAAALWVASLVIPGMHFEGMGTLLLAGLLLGVVNAVIRPILVVLTLPVTLFTLGFFLLLINAAMLKLVAMALGGFVLDGFWSALFAAIIVSVVSTIASWFIGPKGRFNVVITRRGRYR